jgi:hypothetical protein
MIRDLGTILAVLAMCSAAPAQQVCDSCAWADRGDRFEGVESREQISGGSFELVSVHYLRPTEAAAAGPQVHLYFWLPEALQLDEIRVAQPARYYRMEPARRQYGEGLQDFAWPRGEVIAPLGLSVDALYARLRAGNVYVPALLSTRDPAAATGGYAFVFESGAGIDADCTVTRQDGAPAIVRRFECFEEYGGMIAIEWDGRGDDGKAAADGLYVLDVVGDMLAETIRPLKTSVAFRHRGRLP